MMKSIYAIVAMTAGFLFATQALADNACDTLMSNLQGNWTTKPATFSDGSNTYYATVRFNQGTVNAEYTSANGGSISDGFQARGSCKVGSDGKPVFTASYTDFQGVTNSITMKDFSNNTVQTSGTFDVLGDSVNYQLPQHKV